MLDPVFGHEHSLGKIFQSYWPIFPVAFVIALIATPICHKLATRFGIVDVPNDTVKTHSKPTAYLGGVGILAGLLGGLAVGFFILYRTRSEGPETSGMPPNWMMLTGIGLGAAIACAVGLLDDLRDLKPWQKFLGQSLTALLLWGAGVTPNLIHFFGYFDITLPPVMNSALGLPIVLFFILGASNSLNLLDGLDGLCAGVTAIITLAYLLLALSLATWGYSAVGDPVRLILCLALVGGTLGFLPMNRHPARIFMGDAGSMLLGFIAGTLMILFTEKFGKWSIAAIIIFGLPVLDTSVALVRRWFNHHPLFVSDRGHIYDQLMDRGWGLIKTVKFCYILAGLYALIGLLSALTRFRWATVLFVLVFAVSGWIVARKGFLRMPDNPKRD